MEYPVFIAMSLHFTRPPGTKTQRKKHILTLLYPNITHAHLYLCTAMKNNINPLKQSNMNTAIVFTPHVLNTLRALPYEERTSVASALAGELLLGAGQCNDLAPEESMIYEILRFYVNQASARYNNSK